MNLFSGLIDDKTLRVLRLFFRSPKGLFHINKVSQETGVPLATAFRIIHSLEEHGIISYTRVGKLRIYSLSQNTKTEVLGGLL